MARLIPPGEPMEPANLPAAFAWTQRRKSAYPLPGRSGAYITTLKTILDAVVEHQPEREALERWLVDRFSVSATHSRLIIDFLQKSSFIQVHGAIVTLTAQAAGWLTNTDPSYMVALLHSRIQFVGEMVAAVQEPRNTEELLAIANRNYAMGWQTRAQIDRRRGWLQSAGAIATDGQGRLVATDLGLRLLSRLQLHLPHQPEANDLHQAANEGVMGAKLGAGHETTSNTNLVVSRDDVEDRLQRTANLTSAPIEFERAVADAFRSLGYEATHLGGSGQTDVLLVADLGPQDSYRVIVDCKTTAHEGVGDSQIDWITLEEHKTKHKATYVSVIGPAFSGGRVRDRARRQHVTLIDLAGLITLHRQHHRVPMGLDTYRELFVRPDADEGAAAVAEAADDFNRWLALSALALRLVRELETAEGALSARDLYWNVRGHEQLGSVTDNDLQLVLDTLASPPFRLLRKTTEQTYQSIGPLATTAARLRALAALLDNPSTGRDEQARPPQ